MALRRPRRSLIVLGGDVQMSDRSACALVDSLRDLGVDTVYLGREDNASRIATVAVEEGADGIELCLAGGRGVALLRELLRELIKIGRRDVSIVVHRITPP